VQYVDGGTGQPVQTMVDPATGQIVAIDPATGQPMQGIAPIQSGSPSMQTGQMLDPATGLPVEQFVDGNQFNGAGQAIDPVTGFPLQDPNAGFGQAPIDPETGMPMTLVIDPATGQQVWVPSAPTSNNGGQFAAPVEQFAPPAPVQQPEPVYENQRSQRTLMDLIFGG